MIIKPFHSLIPALLALCLITPPCILCSSISHWSTISVNLKHHVILYPCICICCSSAWNTLSHHHPHFLQPLSNSCSFFKPQHNCHLHIETPPPPASPSFPSLDDLPFILWSCWCPFFTSQLLHVSQSALFYSYTILWVAYEQGWFLDLYI